MRVRASVWIEAWSASIMVLNVYGKEEMAGVDIFGVVFGLCWFVRVVFDVTL